MARGRWAHLLCPLPRDGVKDSSARHSSPPGAWLAGNSQGDVQHALVSGTLQGEYEPLCLVGGAADITDTVGLIIVRLLLSGFV